MTQSNHSWVDNPTESGVAIYDPDILNECLMHLKYNNEKATPFCINRGSVDSDNLPNILSFENNTLNFNCGTSIIPELEGNIEENWNITSSHSAENGFDIFKSFNNTSSDYCRLIAQASAETPVSITISSSEIFECDYIYIKFLDIYNASSMKNFYIIDDNGDIIFNSNDNITFLEKDKFLIPIIGYTGTSLSIITTDTVDTSNYVNFPKIKLLKKEQVLAYTNIKGNTLFATNIAPIEIPTQTDGTLNIAINNNIAEIIGTIQKTFIAPESPSINDIWLNKTEEPLNAYKWNGTHWKPYHGVPIGEVEVLSSQISSVKTFPYNKNGYLDIDNWKLSCPDYTKGISLPLDTTERTYIAPCNGVVTVFLMGNANQWGYLYINGTPVLRATTLNDLTALALTGEYFLSKGDILKYRNYYASTTSYPTKVTFFPAKGEY